MSPDESDRSGITSGSIGRLTSPTSPNSISWSSTIGLGVAHSLSAKEKKRQEAIYELITTEQAYLSCLYLVRDDFQQPLLNQGLITPEEGQSIFMDWRSLQELSQSIVDELTQRQGSDGGVVMAVGDVINSHIVERADCFMRYCANHRVASLLLVKKMAESRPLLDFLTVRHYSVSIKACCYHQVLKSKDSSSIVLASEIEALMSWARLV